MRLLDDEIGIGKDENIEARGMIEDISGDPRGHLLHQVYLIRVKDGEIEENDGRKFFDHKPDNLMINHDSIWDMVTR